MRALTLAVGFVVLLSNAARLTQLDRAPGAPAEQPGTVALARHGSAVTRAPAALRCPPCPRAFGPSAGPVAPPVTSAPSVEAVPDVFAAGSGPVGAFPHDSGAPPAMDDLVAARGREALARLSYPWQDLQFQVAFFPARDGLRGITYTQARRIEVYVRLSEPVEMTAFDLAHEIGHAVDVTYLTDARRTAWLDERGASGTPWFGCSGCDDFATGAGDFAEVFALWQVGPVDFRSRVAGAPEGEELVRLSASFWPQAQVDSSADPPPPPPDPEPEDDATDEPDPPEDDDENDDVTVFGVCVGVCD